MAVDFQYTRLILRNDSTAAWLASKDQILLKGEVGVEFLEDGTPKIKIGDGVKTWEQLEYFGGESGHVFETEVLAAGANHEEAITALVGETKVVLGDIAIVKETITGDKVSYTAYVYNGTDWAAMDGNYSAKNVYLQDEIELAGSFTTVGNYEKGEKIAAGTSLESILSSMLQQELYPTANDKPNAEITASGGSGEVGTTYSAPTATLKITDVGSYEYGDKATGITFAAGSVKIAEGADPTTATNYKTNESVMTKNSTIQLTAADGGMYSDTSKSYTFSGTASYPAGKVPVTNLGNEYPSAQIPAGDVTIADKAITFSGYRKAFAGGTTAATLDSATIRAGAYTKNNFASVDSQSEALEFTANTGATKVFFAYPSTWSVGTKKPYFEMFGLAWGENVDIVAKDDVQVADARGTVDGELQGAIAYKVYCWELDTPLQAETTKFRVWFK